MHNVNVTVPDIMRIPASLIVETRAYLTTRPYNEVAGLINTIDQNIHANRIDQNAPAETPSTKQDQSTEIPQPAND